MFGTPVNTGLTFTKVLGGLSKTLSVANQVIPLYREAKPMIQNAKTILSVLKGINQKPSSNKVVNPPIKKDSFKEPSINNINQPSFFL